MCKFVYIFLFFSTFLYAQVGGESVYNFLNISNSAKQTSLGGKVITLIGDVNQPSWNPALLNDKLTNQLSVNYINYLADVSIASVSFAPWLNNNIGNVYGGMTYMNYGDFIQTDVEGNELGNFKAYDMLFTMGYSYNLPNSNIYLGANLKFINSVIENYSSFGIGSDVAISYYTIEKPFVLALSLRNIGNQVTVFDEENEKLPIDLILGASYKLQNVPIAWHVAVDNLQKWNIFVSNPSNTVVDLDGNEKEEKIAFFDNALRHFSFGAELFSEKSFNLRLGYNFRRSKELFLVDKRTFAGFTAGFGLKLNKFNFNYAFSKFHPASNVNTFSLQINLN